MIETLITAVKSRKIDVFHQIESETLKGNKLDKEDQETFHGLLSSKDESIDILDKLRALIIYLNYARRPQ